MFSQIGAILSAQLRSLLHQVRSGEKIGPIVSGVVLAGWYGMWLVFAVIVGTLTSRSGVRQILDEFLPRGLLLMAVYWQAAPVLLTSHGASLDLRKLRVYPIPTGRLFGIEVLLRVSTSAEMLLVTCGLATGLMFNNAVPIKTAPPALALFALFNLLIAAGLRLQIERWLARRRLRELLVLLVVLVASLPQLVALSGITGVVRRALEVAWGRWWPWSSIADLALGRSSVASWAASLAWLVLAGLYSRRQFQRNLNLEPGAESSAVLSAPGRFRLWLDTVYRLPSRLFADPFAAIIEKEIRSMVRSPRFRLVFAMGFTFGVLVFMPLALRGRSAGAEIPTYRLTLLVGYALLLLGDVVFWNIFGTDRSAAQFYFLQPLSPAVVIAGKNLVAGIFVFLEVTGVIVVWSLLRMPISPGRIFEVYLAAGVLCIYMISAGNLTSVYYPRAVNSERTTGAGSSPVIRVLLMLMLPVLSVPVILAYVFRHVYHTEIGFHATLAAGLLGGARFYWFALNAATEKAEERKETFLDALSAGGGPVEVG
jgi:ABC-2 type transport system permease protein